MLRIQTFEGLLGTRQATLGARRNIQVVEQMLRRRISFHRIGNAQIERIVNEAPPGNILPIHEGYGGALMARTAGTPGAVQIGFLVFGHAMVNHMGYVFHINTAGCNIGRHQNIHLAVAESTQSLLASALVEVAVQGSGGESARNKLIGNTRSITLSLREDHGASPPMSTQDAAEHFVLIHMVHAVNHLTNRGLGLGVIFRVCRANMHGLSHVFARHRDHRARHCRGEQHGLAVGG